MTSLTFIRKMAIPIKKNQLFVKRSEYIRVKNPLHKPSCASKRDGLALGTIRCMCLRTICKEQEFAAFCKLKLCMTNLVINNFEVQWRLVHFNFKQLVQHMAALLSSVGQFALRDVFLQFVLLSTKN